MQGIFEIDGKSYNVGVEMVTRKASIRDGENADTSISGTRWRDVIGTFFDYTMRFSASGMSQTEYDELYEVLSDPADSHMVRAPYGQSLMEFEAYIEVLQDEVESMDDGTVWGNLAVSFYAKKPQKVPK